MRFLIMYGTLAAVMALVYANTCKIKQPAFEPLVRIAALPDVLRECSGMEKLDDASYVALNDSGSKSSLYILDRAGKIKRNIKIRDVKQLDWEDIASDDEHIYIGDFGNNSGIRRNLMIYKVSKAAIHGLDEVPAEIIGFSYAGQTKFEKTQFHNFDCEAMISKGDSLYLFTKNRGDFRTDAYALPKTPGEYVVSPIAIFDTEGLVTGADFRQIDSSMGELVFIGYTIHGKANYPFILHFSNISGSQFFDGNVKRQIFRENLQTESIIFDSPGTVLISNEDAAAKAFLYEVKL